MFVAQHATATCCRACLSNWHKISKNRDITIAEKEYILNVVEMWILREYNKRGS